MATRLTPLALALALSACSAPPVVGHWQVAMSPADRGTITIQLSDFAFDPNHLQLKVSEPVRLRLVNDGGGDHDFSAPSFFAASTIQPGSPAAPDGRIEVPSHQTVEISMVPRVSGQYPLECTHFLHSVFGMTGTIEVTP